MKKIFFTLSILCILQSTPSNGALPTSITSNATPIAGVVGSYLVPALCFAPQQGVYTFLDALPACVGCSAACLLKQYAIQNSWAKNMWITNPIASGVFTFAAFATAGGLTDFLVHRSPAGAVARGSLAATGGFLGVGFTNWATGK